MKKLSTLIRQWRERRLRYKIISKLLKNYKSKYNVIDDAFYIINYINTGDH